MRDTGIESARLRRGDCKHGFLKICYATEYRIPQDPDDPEAAAIELLTDSVVIEYHAPPGYAEAVASGRAFAGMVWTDARRAANTISRDIWCYGVADPRVASSLRQRAANVACGSDVQSWHDRSAVSNAFGIAADALAESCAEGSA